MIDTKREQKIEIRWAVNGFLFARADEQGMYFFDRRVNVEILMKWEEIHSLQEQATQGETTCVRIAG